MKLLKLAYGKKSKSNKKPASAPRRARKFFSQRTKSTIKFALLAIVVINLFFLLFASLQGLRPDNGSFQFTMISYSVATWLLAFVSTFYMALFKEKARYVYAVVLLVLLFFAGVLILQHPLLAAVPVIHQFRYAMIGLFSGWLFGELAGINKEKSKAQSKQVKNSLNARQLKMAMNRQAWFSLVCLGVFLVFQLILNSSLLLLDMSQGEFVSFVLRLAPYLVVFFLIFILTINKDIIRFYPVWLLIFIAVSIEATAPYFLKSGLIKIVLPMVLALATGFLYRAWLLRSVSGKKAK